MDVIYTCIYVHIYMYIQVRDETNKVQFGRMDKEQQEEMNEFKRPVLV